MNKLIRLSIFILISAVYFPACTHLTPKTFLNHDQLATKYYGTDTAWYLHNIPFFECSDSTLEQVYYYRWNLYKSHIRNVGPEQFVITAFINHVGWDRDPWSNHYLHSTSEATFQFQLCLWISNLTNSILTAC